MILLTHWRGKLFLLYLALVPHVVRCFVARVKQPCRPSGKHDLWTRILETSWPLAVLRDLDVERGEEIASTLYAADFRMVSVTVDTKGFEKIVRECCDLQLPGMVIGVSSVTSAEQVDTAFECGAEFISSTCLDLAVVRRTKELGMLSIPGVSTESQATEAVAAGGDILKVFPANKISPATTQRIVNVSYDTPVIVAGGVEVVDLKSFSSAGVAGFAVGRTLFTPDMTSSGLKVKAERFMRAARTLSWAQLNRQEARR